jgi:hypothetical protein
VGVDGVLAVQVHEDAEGAYEAFGGLPVLDHIPGEYHIQQVRQLPVENLI